MRLSDCLSYPLDDERSLHRLADRLRGPAARSLWTVAGLPGGIIASVGVQPPVTRAHTNKMDELPKSNRATQSHWVTRPVWVPLRFDPALGLTDRDQIREEPTRSDWQ